MRRFGQHVTGWCAVFLAFLLPLKLGTGQTLGQKIFGVGLMNTDGVKVNGVTLFIRAILRGMTRSKVKFINKVGGWLERKVEKHKGKIEKYSYWGVVLFVAIPIPGTGAWTGSLIAAVLKLDFKKSLLAATLGVLLAGAIMTVISYAIKAVV